jgi:hypothetical protein
MAAASRFAGLIGALSGKKAGSDKDDDKTATAAEKPTQNDGESDEDFQKRLKKWEDSQDDGPGAETPKDTTDDGPNDGDEKKIKKAEAAGHAAGLTAGIVQGAAAEKARWEGVLASDAAKGKVIAACSLLADTDMTAAAIQKTLAALPSDGPARSTLAARHPEPTPAPTVGDDQNAGAPDLKTPQGFAAGVAAALAKAGRKPAKAA